uniref:RcpC/CpaB family pilus assembly protein n=1 Tax=uncultured Microbacterium sp. TaxID=191216 RepID=UPI002586A1D4
MRAVTVPVSARTGVAGFVFPGDRIDLVLTQSVAGGGDGEIHVGAGVTVGHGVDVERVDLLARGLDWEITELGAATVSGRVVSVPPSGDAG